MSSNLTSVELSNADCEKGQVSQRPPISYAQPKSSTTLIASRETIKMKTPEGESNHALLANGADGEEYVCHIMAFHQYLEKLGHEAKLEAASKVSRVVYQSFKKVKGEKPPEKEKNSTAETRDLQKSRLRKKHLRKPRLPSAPSHARPTISFINCYETTQKHNGMGLNRVQNALKKIHGRIWQV